MAIFVPFRLRISNYLLKRKLKHFERKVEIKNIQECKTVLVISELSQDDQASELSRLVNYFRQMNAKTKGLFFIGKTKDFSGIQDADIEVFGSDDLNLFFTPNSNEVNAVLGEEYDLCIDLTLDEKFPLKYAFALSNAKLRVGAAINYKKKFADLTIDVSKKPEISYLITQIKHYLSILNQKEDVA